MIQVARSSATVLIRGESGTGKELIAQSIHYSSDRKEGPFVAVNCAALPENLVESELFGHEKGAFTGAHKMRKGRFEVAAGGTLFLDEIGDISPAVQVKLLRVLQERVFERVGSQEPIKANVRIIAATSRNLEEKMQEGTFREDLFYRLNVFPIHVPPLRARKSDIISLADYFLDKYNAAHNKKVVRISTPAINMLMSYHWPGNVRELENMIERSVLVSEDGVINTFDLPPSLQTAAATNTVQRMPGQTSGGLEPQTAAFETEIITDSLKRNQGNVAASARDLQTTIRKLHYKIAKLGIDPTIYK
jgi:Nif-specific regulatory protein